MIRRSLIALATSAHTRSDLFWLSRMRLIHFPASFCHWLPSACSKAFAISFSAFESLVAFVALSDLGSSGTVRDKGDKVLDEGEGEGEGEGHGNRTSIALRLVCDSHCGCNAVGMRSALRPHSSCHLAEAPTRAAFTRRAAFSIASFRSCSIRL